MTLKEYLKQTKKTQSEFANELGVSRLTVNRAINGEPPGFKTAKLIVAATAQEVSFNDIYE